MKLKLFMALCLSWLVIGYAWASDDEEPQPQVQVTKPYVEWRTGPGEGYPVFHTSERGEWVTLHTRKTRWLKVTDDSGTKAGWILVDDIELMKDGRGRPVRLSEPRFDDFSSRRWEAGVSAGGFEGGNVNAGYFGYWMTENLASELWLSQVLGSASESLLVNYNLVHQPFPTWRVSPFFTLGGGVIITDPKSTLAADTNRSEDTVHWGTGIRWYVTDRYFVRVEYKDYVIFTDRETNEEAQEWKIGLSVFF